MDYGVCTEMHIVHPGSGDGRHASLEDHVEPLLRGEMSRYRVNAAAGGGATAATASGAGAEWAPSVAEGK